MIEELRVDSKKCKFRKNRGITLISLIITIIVLIILASVVIYLSLGNNGIFTRAKQARELTNKQEATDIINLKIINCQMNKYAEQQRMPTLKELSEALIDDEIEYVTEKSQVASTKYEVGENPTSIYTKLKEYPYEFEINSQLQLASIDGIKIATNNSSNSEIKIIDSKKISGLDGTVTFSVEKGKKYYLEVLFICASSANCGFNNPIITASNSESMTPINSVEQAGYNKVYMGRFNTTFKTTSTSTDVYIRPNSAVSATWNMIVTLYSIS